MQKFSPIILLCVVLAVAMAQPVPEKPTTTPLEADMELLEKEPEILEGRELQRPSLGEITDRLTSAVRLTVKDERAAIAKALQEMANAARQSVKAGVTAAQAGVTAAQAGFQIVLILPNIGRNILIDTAAIKQELDQP